MGGTSGKAAAIESLTDRERDTLQLLLVGHDAKSIARHQGLSVHTVNERLRDARRKLGAGSSREAARMLAEAEGVPNSFVPADFGVAPNGAQHETKAATASKNGGNLLPWLLGGILIMSLIIAAVLLTTMSVGSQQASSAAPASRTAISTSDRAAALSAARQWVALVDRGRWADSWAAASKLFKSQLTAQQWGATVQPVRLPLGKVQSRKDGSVARHDSLPGAPAGTYALVEFQTDFAAKSGSVETVVLAREGSTWKVAGYFIR